jgi:hypothetical protein
LRCHTRNGAVKRHDEHPGVWWRIVGCRCYRRNRGCAEFRKKQVRLEMRDGRRRIDCSLGCQIWRDPNTVLLRFERSQRPEQFIPLARMAAMADQHLGIASPVRMVTPRRRRSHQTPAWVAQFRPRLSSVCGTTTWLKSGRPDACSAYGKVVVACDSARAAMALVPRPGRVRQAQMASAPAHESSRKRASRSRNRGSPRSPSRRGCTLSHTSVPSRSE